MVINIGRMFTNRAKLSPELEAYVGENYRYSFSEANQRVNQFAAYLKKTGISAGDRVAVLGKNNEHVIIAMLGAMKTGAIFIPLNFRLQSPELVYILNNCGASLLVYDDEFSAIVDKIRSDIPPKTYLNAAAKNNLNEFEIAIEKMPSNEHEIVNGGDDPAVILYTSGTTGYPKGAILTHNNLFWASLGLMHTIHWFTNYRFLSIAPLFHSGGLAPIMGNIHSGVTTVFMPDFNPVKVWDIIQQEKINFMMSVPAMLNFMLKVPGIDKIDISSLDHIVCGGAAVPESLILTYKDMGIKVENVFGITEYTGAVSFWTHDMEIKKSNSVGLPVIHGGVKILDPGSMKELPQDEIGEICCTGPQIFSGYWRNPEATAAVLKDGYYRSGDLGKIDNDGFLYLVDRLKDLVVSGGENIYPAELEKVIMMHPSIAEVAVVGKNDNNWGEVPVAFIVKNQNTEIIDEEIIKLCRDNLASYKCVKEIRFVDSIPKNALGKVLKKELREHFK